MREKVTAPAIRARKGSGVPVVCVTAYDAVTCRIADQAGVDVILVGDSVGNVVLGFSETLSVGMDEMLHHTRAAARARPRALLVADLPFGSYQADVSEAVRNAVALMKAGAEAVKLEGDYSEGIAACVKAGIPVMGHLGMTPQSVHSFGGHRVQGRSEDAAQRLLDEAKSLEEAGVFGYVLELIPADIARKITAASGVPTIGIGAGPGCDGQIQVFHDVVGLTPKTYKHAKRYVDANALFVQGLSQYVDDVKREAFPTEENSF